MVWIEAGNPFGEFMYLIQIRGRYFSARRGYFGGLVGREEATLFTLADATERCAAIPGSRVVAS